MTLVGYTNMCEQVGPMGVIGTSAVRRRAIATG